MLVIRTLLAWTLCRYGWAKLSDSQFGIDSKSMALPLKDIDLMRLSWYLADHEPFKSFVGISQLLTGGLLLFHRTTLIGAFMMIPIWLNILVWDVTFMEGQTSAFTFRLGFYLMLTCILIYESIKDKSAFIRTMTENKSVLSQPAWVYVTLPVAAVILEFTCAVPSALLSLFRSI